MSSQSRNARARTPSAPSATRRATAVSPARRRTGPKPRTRPVRTALFGGIALIVGGLAIALVVSRLLGPSATDPSAAQTRISMGGFAPAALTAKAGQPVKIEVINTDTAAHTDGGGVHQFANDQLRVDQRIGPLSSQVVAFTAPTTPGTFTFYCDICCGGKENQTMQFKLTVTA
ncbi:MAG TPA: cupredoxin domain-containing protein [Candidatus Limnocylindrales bacterium]